MQNVSKNLLVNANKGTYSDYLSYLGYIYIVFSISGMPHHLNEMYIDYIRYICVGNIFPIEPRKGDAAEIFRESEC